MSRRPEPSMSMSELTSQAVRRRSSKADPAERHPALGGRPLRAASDVRDQPRHRGLRRHRPDRAARRCPIDLFTLDTGLLFPETYELWQQTRGALRRRRSGRCSPEHTVERAGRDAKARRCGSASPTAAAISARCSRCGRRSPATTRGSRAIRRDQTPERANAPVVGWDGRFGLVKVNPLVRWTFDEVQAVRDASTTCRTTRCTIRTTRASAARRARARSPRRGSALRPLARERKDRVRPASQAHKLKT